MKNITDFIKGFLFALLLFVLYFLVLPNAFALAFNKALHSSNFWISNLAYLGIYLCTFLILVLLIHKDLFKQLKEFIKQPKSILNKGFTYWVYGIIVMVLSNLIITSLVGNIPVNEQVTRETILKSPLYAIPTIIFFGPFLEEIVFRFGIRKAFKKEIPYALTSALIFGGLHVLSAIDEFTLMGIWNHISEFLFLIPYGSLGFFFAKAYYETDNIFSTIIPHMLHNTMSVTLILILSWLGV